MEDKLLTIAIPSYNMEEYLSRCMNSLILDNKDLMEKLDIIVVNDGSTDRTSEIAHTYASRFPNIVNVIDKVNGHYGSCINAALPAARGKYFRILDADDWFDTQSLSDLLSILNNVDADCICTNCVDIREKEKKRIKIAGLPYDTLIDLQTIKEFNKYIHMHHISYRTSLLREINYRQTEGICYTDEEFSYYPLIKAKTLYLIDLPIYNYFIGRADQSVNKEVSRKIKHHYFKVVKRMVETPIKSETDNSAAPGIRRKKIKYLVGSEILPNYVLFRKMSRQEVNELVQVMELIKSEDLQLYKQLMANTVRGIPVFKIWKTAPSLFNNLFYHLFKLAE